MADKKLLHSSGFRPMVNCKNNPKMMNLKNMAQNTLRIGDMNTAVELPKGEV